MNTVISAVVSDLISRFISFVIQKSHTHVSTNKLRISRLQRLLLRAVTVVEEAEGRQVTNNGMLLQLKQLKEAMYRGYYVLDTAGIEPCQPKRWGVSERKFGSDMDDLEAILDGMKEFLLVLMHCPPIVRHPYDTYLFMERCMFGRHMEKEYIINFLLHPCLSFDVLPTVGPSYVGKRTLVEHVCRDETVQRNFSRILCYRSGDLNNIANDVVMDNFRKLCPSDGRILIAVDLVHDTDEVAWGKMYSSLYHEAGGSKAILISGMDQVSSLGTTPALRMTRIQKEEYWYFFKVLAFGSANPYDHHPDLASIAKEIATEIAGYFMITSIVTRVLRSNMNVQFWRRLLGYIRRSIQMHILVFKEDPRDMSNKTFCPYFYSFHDGSLIFCYNRYEIAGSMRQGGMLGAKMVEDVLNGRVVKRG
ncbi:uncharacterized protein LOC133923732 [Phragmites australis]|uniref:uncharacterized protein LOC133923732 n=1 Tax=Phragmites australis TaxID=29695 RepID=UPI002D773C27|nr:uncharacterized protein LOC133923732 [Phragmites australis]